MMRFTTYNVDMVLGDNMHFLRRFPDKYFDLAFVDPPYGIRQDGHRENDRSKLAKSKDYDKSLWDQPRPPREYFEQLERVSKNQIIWGGNHLIDLIGKRSPCWIVWDKDNSGNFADCELAYTSFDTAVRKFKFRWNGMLQEDMKNKEQRIHPTQKPVGLYKMILKKYAKPSQKILDTHSGSASLTIACIDLGMDIFAIELVQKYFEDSVERVERHLQSISHDFQGKPKENVQLRFF